MMGERAGLAKNPHEENTSGRVGRRGAMEPAAAADPAALSEAPDESSQNGMDGRSHSFTHQRSEWLAEAV